MDEYGAQYLENFKVLEATARGIREYMIEEGDWSPEAAEQVGVAWLCEMVS